MILEVSPDPSEQPGVTVRWAFSNSFLAFDFAEFADRGVEILHGEVRDIGLETVMREGIGVCEPNTTEDRCRITADPVCAFLLEDGLAI